MAGRKEYDLIFKVSGEVAGSFGKSFSSAGKGLASLQTAAKGVNATLKKIDGIGTANKSIESNSAKLKLLAEEHKKIQTEISNTKNKSKELNEQLKRNETALSKLDINESNSAEIARLEKEHDKLQKAISKTEKTSESLNGKLKRNEEQMEQTSDKIQQEENKLKSLNSELKAAGVNTEDLSGETSRLKYQYDQLKASQDRINSLNEALSKNSAAIQSTKGAIAKTAAVAAVAATAVYKGAVGPASEFQAQMSTVGAISNASNDDMAKLTQTAKELGRTTAFSAVEAGQGMEYAAMAGWKTNQIIAGMPGIMNLAAASGEDLATVSDIVTDALSAMKMQVSESTHFADVLASASSNANVNVSMLGESFKYCAPLAGAYGFNIEDTALMLSLMGNNGIKASNSGTAFRKVLTALSSDLEIAQADGQKFIVSTSNADGSMRSLKDIIDDVRTAFNGMSESEKKAAQGNLTQAAQDLSIELTDENGKLKSQAQLYEEVTVAAEGLTAAGQVQEAEAIAGKTAMAGLLAIINTSEEDYNKLTEAIYNCDGVAEKMAQKRLDNLKGDLTLAKSAAEGLQIALGDALIPELRNVVQSATPVTSSLAEWVEQNPEAVASIAKTITKLIALRGGLLLGKLGFLEIKKGILLGQRAFEVYKGAVAKASVVTNNASTVTSLLGTAVGALSSPVGIAVAAVGGLAAAYGIYKVASEKARQESIHFAEDLVKARDNFNEVHKAAAETQGYIGEYRKLEQVISNSAEGTDENVAAKERLREIEQILIEQNPEILSKYDAENGKISENLEYVEKKIEREKELARIKLEQEAYDAKQKLNDNIKIIQSNEAKYPELQKEYEQTAGIRNELNEIVGEYDLLLAKNLPTDELNRQSEVLVERANKIAEPIATTPSGKSFSSMNDVYFKTNDLNSRAQGLEKSLETANTEINEAKQSLQSYYDIEKQVIELDLGTTYEKAVESYKSMNDELYNLRENGKGSSEKAKELEKSMDDLKPKIDTATVKINDLNKSVAKIPDVHTTEISVNTSQANTDLDNYNRKLNQTPKTYTTTFMANVSESFQKAINYVKSAIGQVPKTTDTVFGAIIPQVSQNGIIEKNAKGGIVERPILTTFAEEGPEAAIPLDGSERAKRLWVTAGRRLGMNTGITESEPVRTTSSAIKNDWNINVTYNVYGGNNSDIAPQLEENNKRLMEMLAERDDRQRRLSYV
ncbi:MAG: phage tail tape measure protein [Clostridia bacterium]|nr:phage tail tape measure protein [Clostridia bacterium]